MNREQRMVEALVELSDSLVNDFDVPGQLDRLATRCTELLDITAAAVVRVSADGGRWTSATSGSATDLFELLTREGPVLESCRTGAPVGPVGVAAARRQWPGFAVAASKAGYRQVSSVPMRLGEEVLGSVLLLHADAEGLQASDIRLARALADAATIGLVHEREIRQRTDIALQLQSALDSRVLIEQAKGFLAARQDMSVIDAFELISVYARQRRCPISDVARQIIEFGVFPVSPPRANGPFDAR
ncbi:ANTAR domain-containing protein [Amycolatopsis coloradensis]|uniref:ANTAR domain-containing protein n=1 Tax=Amycolatopsis coloradensis TaxID=76021 RepID=A0ACD5BP89_9PSEU